MTTRAWAMVVAATLTITGCKRDGSDGSAAPGAAPVAVGETSPAIDQLIAAVPGDAIGIGFYDSSTTPWSYIVGGAGFLDAATRTQLDKELREYLDRFIGVDVSRLQHAVTFVSGPPISGAILLSAVSGSPKLPGASDYEGAKLWLVDRGDDITLAVKGTTVIVGKGDAVRGAIDTLAGKRKSVIVENPALVGWLKQETKGAAVALAAVAPKGIPLPPPLAGLERVAMSIDRTKVRAIVEGSDAAIGELQKLVAAGMAKMTEEVERAHASAVAGDIPPPAGAFAIIGAAYAKSYAGKLAPRRDGNRLITQLDFPAMGANGGMEAMMMVSVAGILAAVAIPAFMDYKKKAVRSEASLHLNRIAKNLKVAYITDQKFPVGEVGLTPSASCCQGPGGECPVMPDLWQQPVWQAVDFALDMPHQFRYSYKSDGTSVLVEAVGDTDCDGVEVTYKLEVSAPNGNPMATVSEPQNAD